MIENNHLCNIIFEQRNKWQELFDKWAIIAKNVCIGIITP